MEANKQAQEMMDVWLDSQKQFYQSWSDAHQNMWGQWGELFADSPAQPMAGMANVWREAMSRNMDAWFGDSSSVAKSVAEQIVSGQNAVSRFVELSYNMWRTITPDLEKGEDWQSKFNEMLDQMREQFGDSSTGMLKAMQDMNTLWGMYTEELQLGGLPWAQALQQMPNLAGPLMEGDSEAWIEVSNLYWDAYDQSIGRLIQSPTFGMTREVNATLIKGFSDFKDYQKANTEYQILLSETYFQAFEELMTEVFNLAQQGQRIDSLSEYLRMWARTADKAFAKLFSSRLYIETQARMVNTSNAYRIRRRELLEMVLEANDMPTRTEVDEAHRRIYELRKEVRTLKRQISNLEGQIEDQTDYKKELTSLKRKVTNMQKDIKTLKAEDK